MKNLNVKINIKDTFLWDDPDFIKAYLDLCFATKSRTITQLSIDWKWSRPRVYRFIEKIGSVTPSVTTNVTGAVTSIYNNIEGYKNERTLGVTSDVTQGVTDLEENHEKSNKKDSAYIYNIYNNINNNKSNSIKSNSLKKKENIINNKELLIIKEKRNDFVEKPKDLQMVIEYFTQQGIADPTKNAKKFFDHYEANGWYRGKTKIKRWRSCLTQWDFEKKSSHSKTYTYECPGCRNYKIKNESDQLFAHCPTCDQRLLKVFV